MNVLFPLLIAMHGYLLFTVPTYLLDCCYYLLLMIMPASFLDCIYNIIYFIIY